jgi:hypothetical protein
LSARLAVEGARTVLKELRLPMVDLARLHPVPIAKVRDRHLVDQVLPQNRQLLRGSPRLAFATHRNLQAKGLCKPHHPEIPVPSEARQFYDLAKFQYFFNELNCEVGVEIVPAHRLKTQMSTGVAHGEQLIFDIGRLRRHFPAVAVKVILIDVEPPSRR